MSKIISFLCAVIAITATYDPIPASAQSRPCGNRAPVNTAAWSNFSIAVENDYGSLTRMNPRERMIVLGHALARFERGAGGRTDAECVRLELQRQAGDLMMMGDITNYEKLRQDAERGQHEGEVARLTGVSSSTPFRDSDFASSGSSFPAGSEVQMRSRVGGSRSGNSNAPGDDAFDFGSSASPNLPNYSDLRNRAGSSNQDNHWHRGFLFSDPPGIASTDNWVPGQFYNCYQRLNLADRGAGLLKGGFDKGSVAILSVQKKFGRRRNLFTCNVSHRPFQSLNMSEMESRAAQLLRACRRDTVGTKNCRIWFMN